MVQSATGAGRQRASASGQAAGLLRQPCKAVRGRFPGPGKAAYSPQGPQHPAQCNSPTAHGALGAAAAAAWGAPWARHWSPGNRHDGQHGQHGCACYGKPCCYDANASHAGAGACRGYTAAAAGGLDHHVHVLCLWPIGHFPGKVRMKSRFPVKPNKNHFL